MKYDIAVLQQQVQSAIRERQVIGNYEIKRKIGEGSFSSVFLAVHIMTHHEVVLKSAEKNQPNLSSEISNMSLLFHPHIVRLYEYIVTTDKVWLVLEYCGGEELFSYLVRRRVIPPQQACQLFAQLAGAVAYAHQKNCAHRDIKLENVLLDENGLIKLGDFGFTRNYLPKTMLETVCGTESYMAPELLLHKRYYPEAADVWSLGVILYAMIYGKFPFDDDNVANTNRLVIEEDPPFPTVEGGELLVEITRRILNKDPRKRPSVAQILDQLGESGKQQQVLLLKHEAHPELTHVFTSKEERRVLKGMKALNIDLHAVAFSVVNHKCDPLHGLWYTALDRQRVLKQRQEAGDAPLHRRKSRASIHSARSFVGHTLTRSSQRSLSRPASVSKSSTRAMSLTSPSAPDLQSFSFPDAESEDKDDDDLPLSRVISDSSKVTSTDTIQESVKNPRMESPRTGLRSATDFPIDTNAGSRGVSPGTGTSRSSSATPAGTLRSSGDGSAPSVNTVLSSSKSRRALAKLWAALKLKRNDSKNTLIAYYKPSLEPEPELTRPPLAPDEVPKKSEQYSPHPRVSTPRKIPSRDISPMHNSPVLDLASKTFLPNGRSSSMSVASSLSLAPTPSETIVRRGTVPSIQQPSISISDEAGPPKLLPQPALGPQVSQASGPSSHNSVVSSKSHSSQTSQPSQSSSQGSQGSPIQAQSAFTVAASLSGISRPMSNYSEMSSLSQISESSVDATQLLSDVQESPQDSKQNPAQRWRSVANGSGLSTRNDREAVSPGTLSTPPRLVSMRQRVRMLSLKERIPQKIDESEGEEADED